MRAGDAEIAYEVSGEGEPLLMIMGLAADSRMWVMQHSFFAQHHRVITFDNRGTGASSSPPGPYAMDRLAADAIAVLDAAGVERAHILGISLGGAIAQHIALDAPERVRSLVLAATWARRNEYTERMSEVGLRLAEAGGLEGLIRASMLWLMSPRTIISQPAAVAQVEALAMQIQPPVEVFRVQVDALSGHDVLDRLGSVTAPALVLTGTRDILVPPELGEELAGALPNATHVSLDCAHAMNFEAADEFNNTILKFLAAAGG